MSAKTGLTMVPQHSGVACSVGIGWINGIGVIVCRLRVRVVCILVMSWVVYGRLGVPGRESSLVRLVVGEGYVRVLIYGGR